MAFTYKELKEMLEVAGELENIKAFAASSKLQKFAQTKLYENLKKDAGVDPEDIEELLAEL